jgi:outer membrane protein OmpA-like peptidoglycan-associated protein
MKRLYLYLLLAAAFGISTQAVAQPLTQSQFRFPELAWGFSLGGAHGDNVNGDRWGMQARGFLQYELISPMLIGQIGLGYAELSAPDKYFAKTGIADFRLLFTPFSLANLNPYLYLGIGASKKLNTSNSDFLPIVPLGAGIQTRISNGILLAVNGGYNLSLSDKLDGIARSNTDMNALTNGKNDGYFGFSLGLAFTIAGGYDEAAELKAKALAEENARRLEAEENARHAKQLTDAEALRVKGLNDAEALRVKGLADAEARRMKDLSDAEARRLADLNSRPKDTVLILEKGKTVVLKGVNFEFNKATLTDDSAPILQKAYNALIANADVKIVITGHTDNVGSKQYNQKLSLKRAQSVRNWLVKKGIASNRMRTVGRGFSEPVASNDTEEGRAENRRMEFYVQE